MDTTTEQSGVRIHPLWRNCLKTMQDGGLAHGNTYTAKWLEDQLSCDRESQHFSRAVSRIRLALLPMGFYLSGEGQNGNQFVIVPPENNADQGIRWQRQMIELGQRTVTLLAATAVGGMTPAQRAKHEATLEHAAKRQALLARSAVRPMLPP